MFHVIDLLISPFDYSFMTHAWLAGTMTAILAGAVGFFVVVRRLGFAAHALGHISFVGAAAAILLGQIPLIGQLVVTSAAGAVMGGVGLRPQAKETTIGITLALALGLGMLLLHFHHAYSGQIHGILWGDLLSVSTTRLYWMFGLMIGSLFALSWLGRPLWFSSLSPTLARAKGVPLRLLNVLFFILMAFAITLASQAVGVLLVFALVIGGPAIALQWTCHFWRGVLLSCALSCVVVWVSILLSYYTDWPISFWVSGFVFVLYWCKRF